ncbi:MAG: hypothetical protein ACI857_000169 [Arenicella sp.]|jgi:hypothetical protein
MKRVIYFAAVITVFYSCSGNSEMEDSIESTANEKEMSFTELSPEESGIQFSNDITETDSFNFFNYEYIYNGGGVAVGDINNDGLEDLYFSGNQVSDKLYLNQGGLKFKDITSSAIGAKSSEGWHTGVLMQDVNGDGWLDIYVSRSGPEENGELLANLLFINNQDETFTEKAEEYGLEIETTTTQSLFFDKDNDGDLDLYLLNHPYNTSNSGGPKRVVGEINELIQNGSPFSDKLFENVDGHFVDVTKKCGISNYSFGLGIAASDLNGDGFTDLYISNDYMAPDYLYINQGDGTFVDESQKRMKHMSNYSMGNDVSDFNNDGFPDIFSVDMVSNDHVRSKKNMGGMSTVKFWETVKAGYHHQFMFNCLQMNNGNGTFSDVAQMAGISKTDWSWAPLFADFNNDGLKDLYITNGYRRDSRDNDFTNGYNPQNVKVESFADVLDLMPQTKVENYMFMNNGDLTFTNVNQDWNTDQLVNSNGAIYSDLDGDGDLDLVVNNIDERAFVLENNSSGNHFIDFQFEDVLAEGTVIKIETKEGIQINEFRTVRGYQSSVSHKVHFGLASNEKVEKVTIIWPDNSQQTMKSLEADQLVMISKSQAIENFVRNEKKKTLLTELEVLNITHREQLVNDFEREVLLPNKMSQLGPFLSKGDINEDGQDDFYLSGSRGFSGQLFIAEGEGFKLIHGPWESQKKREEMGSVMFDADNDGDLDIYVVSGSNEYNFDDPGMEDQLYINEGEGRFNNTSSKLPKMVSSGQKVVAGDYDNDGDTDLFIGGRQTPGFYPFAPRSYLLENVGGEFVDVTGKSPAIMGPGMITDCEFVDLDDDNDLDLVVVGEWMAPTFFRNDGGLFTDITLNYNTQDQIGWWSSVTTDDLNNDGKPDFIFGNIGKNNKFHPSEGHPLEIYTHDFDENGTYDIVLAKYQDNTCYPVRGKQCSTEQMPFVSQKFKTYGEYATAELSEIYGQDKLDKALHFSAIDFDSRILMSQGSSYKLSSLPNSCQKAPLNAVIITDFNKDGILDIIGAGNNYGAEVETVRYDAGTGFILLGKGNGEFDEYPISKSGFFANSDVKDMKQINDFIVVSSNQAKLLFFK